MKRIFYLLFLSLLIMQSCNRQKSSGASLTDVSILIDLDSVKRAPLKLADIRYIPLETSKECLIGNADKVLIRNGKIYVADFYQAMSLFVFDLEGKFLFKIARRGQGPGEYIRFRDFDIHSNGDIYIFDQSGKKILILDQEGKYLRTVMSDYYFQNFCVVGEKMYWAKFSDGEKFADLAVYNMMNERTTFLLKDKKFLHNINVNFSTYKFYCSPDNIYYSPQFSEIIYSLKENGIFPAIGIKNLPVPLEEVIEKLEHEQSNIQMKYLFDEKIFLENVYIYETDSFISIGYKRGIYQNTLLYNKHSKSTYLVLGTDFFKNVGSTDIIGSTGKEFFSVIYLDINNEYHKQILTSREELKNWKEDDNPVIAIFNLDM